MEETPPSAASLRRRIHPGSIAPRRLIESGKPGEATLLLFPFESARFFLRCATSARSTFAVEAGLVARTHARTLLAFIRTSLKTRLSLASGLTANLRLPGILRCRVYFLICIVLSCLFLVCIVGRSRWAVEWGRVKANGQVV